MSGAEALKRACAAPRRPNPAADGEGREGQIVDAAFRKLAPVIKGWIRSRVRAGASALDTVARLSEMLQAGQSIASAAGTIAKALQDVQRAVKK